MSAEDMHEAPRCQHVRLYGRQCQAPARRGNNYCLFHEAEHVNEANLTFPPVEDAATVAVATDQVLQALRDDTIDFHRAALLFSGLRIARANLKLLGLELGDEPTPSASSGQALPKAVRVGHPDDDDLEVPSLAEIMLDRLSEIEAEDAAEQGRPAPAPIDIKEAMASGKDLGQILIERLQIVEKGDNNSAVPQPGLGVTPPEQPATDVPG
jgi:hypothetical protein